MAPHYRGVRGFGVESRIIGAVTSPLRRSGDMYRVVPTNVLESGSSCSRFESLILSHHSRFTCECNKEEINDD